MTIAHSPPAVFSIQVDGIDASDKFNRFLIKVSIVLNSMLEPDKAEITLDETDGQLEISAQLGTVIIGLGWQDTGPVQVFSSNVEDSFSRASRSRGRCLVVKCNGWPTLGEEKTTLNEHMDDATFQDAAQKFAPKGMNVKIDPALASKRTWRHF